MTPAGARRLALGVLALAGCSARKAAGDGGAGEAGALAGSLSFDVTAAVKVMTAAADPVNLAPPTSTFSLTLDTERRLVIAGVTAVPATTSDGRTFRAGPFDIAGTPQGCAGLEALTFDSLEITLTETSLWGRATGTARLGRGATRPFTAELTGTPDTTAAFLVTRDVPRVLDPFAPLSLPASEPLPSGVRARLVGSDGSSFDMIPSVADGVVPVVSRFAKPDVVLTPGAGYSVAIEGLVDFAGNASPDSSLRLGMVADAPLASEDGFESVTSPTFGGAALVRPGDLAPISGAQSLYIGGPGTPGHNLFMLGPWLIVRLAMQPGDTKLRFTFRTVSVFGALAFDGTVRVGSAGAKPSDGNVTFQAPPDSTTSVWVGVPAQVTVGGDQTMEIALPPDAHDEVVVAISTREIGCGSTVAVGMVVDDMRLE